jgi:hypothetical protein
MTTDIKPLLHNITSKAGLCYGSENWIISKRDAQQLDTAHMRFMRPSLGLTRLNHQRNSDIRNRLKVDNIVEDIKLYQKNSQTNLKIVDRNRITKLTFQYQRRGTGRTKRSCWDQQHRELLRNSS